MVMQTTQITAIINDDIIHYTLQVANHKINGSKEEKNWNLNRYLHTYIFFLDIKK